MTHYLDDAVSGKLIERGIRGRDAQGHGIDQEQFLIEELQR